MSFKLKNTKITNKLSIFTFKARPSSKNFNNYNSIITFIIITNKNMRLLSPRYTRCCCLVFMLVLLLHTEICSISTTSMSDSYHNNTTLWHNLYRHKSIDCNNLYWLHPAKTSSSFIIPLQHVCCPELFENITSGVTREMLEENLSVKVTVTVCL